MQFSPIKRTLQAVLLLVASAAAGAEPPEILTSIKPLQLIAQELTEGVTEVDVLLKPGSSPHSHSLKPSDARKLKSADVIFWVGPSMEAFLPKILGGLKDTKSVAMMEAHGINLRSMEEDDNHIHDDHGHAHDHDEYDPHIWLSTDNARVMAKAMVKTLVSVDPANKKQYEKNLEVFGQRLNQADEDNLVKVKTAGTRPFFVFHNAYGYLEEQYGFQVAGFFTTNPDYQPGANHLVQLQEKLQKAGSACIFREPQFQPAYIDRLSEGLDIEVGVLDPLAEDIEPGSDSYARFINSMVDTITDCLQEPLPESLLGSSAG
ncbi:zinc ABC transporter substrate-binding protein ZnuA [Endozoicomonas ascidiicola]|uniref:zinc ABC transporter substrate-binding protein ZnuA n=1 Tax=Endozoicomonas ascidiicola TaxID=1698521 RepID=UPI0012F9509B|nr:zinc ABC transporter substrate-binding protein ZnuA [Endozoicomonas ascidiicola]